MSAKIRPLADVDRRAREVLTRELGIVDTLRFLGQFRTGSGDYTSERGEWLGVIGPNGAGKTTLLRSAAHLVRYEGSIHIDGQPAAGLRRRALARLVAYVPQLPELPPGMSVAGRAPVRRARAVTGCRAPCGAGAERGRRPGDGSRARGLRLRVDPVSMWRTR